MNIPPPLLSSLTGQVVAVPRIPGSDWRSLVAKRTLVVTDAPGIYLHDGGAVMGTVASRSLLGDQLVAGQTWSARWTQTPGQLALAVRFNDGTSVDALADGVEAEAVARVLGGASAGAQDPGRGPVASETFVRFVESPASLHMQAPLPPPVAEALRGCVTLRPELLPGRVRLFHSSDPRPVVDAPWDAFRVSTLGHRLDLEGRVPFAGHLAEKLGIHLASSAAATAAAQRASVGVEQTPERPSHHDGAAAGVVAPVQVYGLLDGVAQAGARLDLVIKERSLELRHAESGAVLHTFDLTSNAAGVEGTGSQFVIVDGSAGPLRVDLASEPLSAQIQRHRGIEALARRSSVDGPYLGLTESGAPAQVDIADDGLHVRTPTDNWWIAFDDLGELAAEHPETEHVMRIGAADGRQFSLTTGLLTAFGLYGAVRGANVAHRHRDRPNSEEVARGVLGREGDWLLYSWFGPLLELHIRLLQRWPDSARRDAVSAPSSDAERKELVTGFAGAMVPLREHIEAVAHGLPLFLIEQDEALFARADQAVPSGLQDMAETYSRVFGMVRSLAADLARIERELSRVDSLRARLAGAQQTQLIGLAASTGIALGASILMANPVFLIAPMAQGARMAMGGDQQTKESAGTLTSVAGAVVSYWNHLMLRVLPPVSRRMLDGTYPLRSRVAGELTRRSARVDPAGRAKIIAALAQRFGRLEAFGELPSDPRFSRPRKDAIDFVNRLQDEYEQPQFVPF